jgi:prepilin-type N-terminal cleavage/methylation domain-containing protein
MISRKQSSPTVGLKCADFPESASSLVEPRPRILPGRSRNAHGNRGKAGFTLVEALIVVVIIGILSAAAVSGYRAYIRRAHQQEARRELTAIAQTQEVQRFKTGLYTSSAADLVGLGWTGQANSRYYSYVPAANVDANGIPQFTATATGVTGTDVAGDQWVVDQNGNCQHNGGTCN